MHVNRCMEPLARGGNSAIYYARGKGLDKDMAHLLARRTTWTRNAMRPSAKETLIKLLLQIVEEYTVKLQEDAAKIRWGFQAYQFAIAVKERANVQWVALRMERGSGVARRMKRLRRKGTAPQFVYCY